MTRQTVLFVSALALFCSVNAQECARATVYGQQFDFCCSGIGHTACSLPPSCDAQPLYGITYSPFGTTQFCLGLDQVQRDLDMIKRLTKRIRTYSVSACPDSTRLILQYARNNGMKVALGSFMSKDLNLNNAEVASQIAFTKEFSDVVTDVIVGNEAVFSEQINVDQACGYVNQVRAGIRSNSQAPVGTAEVWPVIESNVGKQLVACQDKVYYNQQPFWEGFFVDCPRNTEYACADAPVYTFLKLEGLEKFYGKEFVLAETGWPTKGEPCCDGQRPNAIGGFNARPTPANAAYFAQVVVAEARQRNRPYYFHTFEDGDWKRVFSPCRECTGLGDFNGQSCQARGGCEVDYNFGLFTSNRQPKPEFKQFPLCGF